MEIKDSDENAILEALRASPRLKACFLEMLDITDGEGFEELNSGDDAEEAVVDVIQKTGHALLQEWVEKKKTKAERDISGDKAYRVHEKKRSDGKLR